MSGAVNRSGLVFIVGIDAEACLSLRDMLVAHPAIGMGLDSRVYGQVAELRHRMRRSIDQGFIDLFCDAERLDAQLRDFLAGLTDVGEHEGPTVCAGEPDDGAHVADLLALVANSRVVYVVGDPRIAIARALRDSTWPTSMPGWARLETTLRRVRSALDAGFEIGRRMPERILIVSSARFSSEPEAQARRVCAFVGVPWDVALLARLRVSRPADPCELSPGVRFRVAQAFADHDDLRAQGYDLAPSALPAFVRFWGGLGSGIGRMVLAVRRRLRASRHAGVALSPSKEST